MIRAILFDKDDTLLDLTALFREPVRRMAQRAARERGFSDTPAWEEAVFLACGIEGDHSRDGSPIVSGTDLDAAKTLNPLLAKRGLAPIDAKDYSRILEQASAIGQVRPKNGEDLPHWFSHWKKKGLLLGLISSDTEDACRTCLSQLKILPFFDDILADGQGLPPKPDPALAQAFLRRHALSPREALYVGDSESDMRFVKNAGISGILYRRPAPEVLPEGAAACISAFSELDALCCREA